MSLVSKLRQKLPPMCLERIRLLGGAPELRTRTAWARPALCMFFLSFLFVSAPSGASPVVSQGQLDLRDWSFEENGTVALQGEWQFFWEQLLTPGQISGSDYSLKFVPSLWTAYEPALPVEGFATYRLIVLLPRGTHNLAIFNPGQGSAYALWINGSPEAGAGRVGVSRTSMQAAKKRETLFIGDRSGELELILQISNFHHRKAGFRDALTLGLSSDIHRLQRTALMVDAVMLGMVLCISVFFLMLFLTRPVDPAPFYFGFMCLITVIRGSIVNQELLSWYLPDTAWAILLKIEYVCFFWTIVLYVGFMRSLYPTEYPSWVLWSKGAISTVFSLATVFSSTLVASQLIPTYQVIYLTYMLALLIPLVLIIRRKRDYYLYIAVASVLGAAFNTIDVAHIMGFVPFGDLSLFGFLTFILVQAIMLSKRTTRDRAEVMVQRQRAREFEEMAHRDPLTRVANRRQFEAVADHELSRSQRSGRPLSLTMIDLDHFKEINDEYGHLVGDEVLVAVSQLVKDHIRRSDLCARYGGEEFVLVMPETTLAQAVQLSSKLRADIANLKISSSSGDVITISVSMGVASWRPATDLSGLLDQADQALYRAKADGRNCLRTYAGLTA